MQRAALYIRVSTDEQAMHGYSIDAQREALTQFAIKNNYHIVDYYTDEGLSARKNYKKRKEFMRMIEDVKSDKIDLILFIKLDRWFRSIKDYYDIQCILEHHNVAWKTIYEQYDTATASGRLHVNIMLSVAQDEADRTSERIKFIFTDKVRRGEVITGNMAFGYKIIDKKLVIEPHEADIVKDIFNHYLYLHSKYAMISYVKDKYGIILHHNRLSRMLVKRIYLGEYRGIPNYCEPIITHEVFDAVQKVIKSNVKVTNTRYTYIYTGLLRCPVCGRNLASAKTKTSEHVYNIHYRCNGRYQDKHCTFNRIIGEKKIDEYLINNIESEIKSCIIRYESKSNGKSPYSAKAEREKLIRKLDKLKDLYLNDLIDRNAYKSDYEIYNRQLDEIKDDCPEKQTNLAVLQEFLKKDIKKIYANLSREEKQTLWRNIIKEIQFDVNTLKPTIFFC